MRKVKVAFLHSNLSIPGVSNEISATLNPADPQSKIKDAVLYWTLEGLEIRIRGREVLVPSTNVRSVEFFPEDKPKAVSAA